MTKDDIPRLKKVKRRNTALKACIFLSVLIGLIVISLSSRHIASYFTPDVPVRVYSPHSILDIDETLYTMPVSSPQKQHTDYFSNASGDDDEEEVSCENIESHDDPCEFIQKHCQDEAGYIDYLAFRYCTLKTYSKFSSITLSILAFSPLALILLVSLGSTAEIWFVPGLSLLSKELNISPVISGMTMVAAGNGAPDIVTTVRGVKTSKGFELILGSLSGAAVCIGACVIGLTFIVSANSRIGKMTFMRYMAGSWGCIGSSIIILAIANGKATTQHGIIFVTTYTIYTIISIIYEQYLQRQINKQDKLKRKENALNLAKSRSNLFKPASNDMSESLLDHNDDGDDDSTRSYLSSDEELLKNTQSNKGSINNSDTNNTRIDIIHTPHLNHDDDIDQGDIDTTRQFALYGASQPHGHLHMKKDGSDADADNDNITIQDGSDDDDDDDDDDCDQSTFMEGLTFPDPRWAKMTRVEFLWDLVLYIGCWPLSLLRWISVPCTAIRTDYLHGAKKLCTLLSPLPLTFIITLNFIGDDFFSSTRNVIILTIVSIILTILYNILYFFIVIPSIIRYNANRAEIELYIDSKQDQTNVELTDDELNEISNLHIQYDLDLPLHDAKPIQMTLFMSLTSICAFLGSLSWLSILADELVNILQAFGIMFSISPTLLGLTVLALGNSIGDLIADTALSKKGKTATSYGAIFGAPLISNSLGLGIALLLQTIKNGTIEYSISTQVILCWISVITLFIIHVVAFPLFKFKPPAWWGYIMIGYYLAFIVGAIIVESVA